MAWLHEHQPQVARSLEKPEHTLQDFLFLRHFSYDCKQVFSGDRWALTGEAGLFLDPFYSPGSDFIAMSNTFISDLIEKDRAPKWSPARLEDVDITPYLQEPAWGDLDFV